ncbi:hypothetical protein [Streptomyces viridochromogenes]|uniref:hypothetical protein n=1 Tax=Streptomyces viridochromogenes TaxID=1938 RepID=UPI00069E1D18|nr:hypothetical protein [Streptomyces viridochromogenes]KOG21781.1 hypothetical protein ADK36_12450 [Streptomyces viridochromogenes]
MGDTFGGQWNRPGEISRKDRQRGRSMREVQDRASYDNEPQLGCGAMFLLCILAIAAAIGLGLS